VDFAARIDRQLRVELTIVTLFLKRSWVECLKLRHCSAREMAWPDVEQPRKTVLPSKLRRDKGAGKQRKYEDDDRPRPIADPAFKKHP
jgi:hypothetical protein